MILRDYICLAHNDFESATGACPYGCSPGMVRQVFKKAPAFHNGASARGDAALRLLADDYKMTDLRQKHDEPALIKDWKKDALTGQTVAVPFQSGASAITSTMSAHGVQQGNALKDMSIPKLNAIPVASYNPKP